MLSLIRRFLVWKQRQHQQRTEELRPLIERMIQDEQRATQQAIKRSKRTFEIQLQQVRKKQTHTSVALHAQIAAAAYLFSLARRSKRVAVSHQSSMRQRLKVAEQAARTYVASKSYQQLEERPTWSEVHASFREAFLFSVVEKRGARS
ncbi:hypothetical protein [Ktedonospora formicarum]|uniref:Uncharacterized protein n=1 Tax=Ktedonospora formicarum TaxID=2778364 RepID=A0A8J3ICF2_9CHLR|nr:hypothetical protein [Ktedonospora formicarum]GHO51413.1 hypothetical protein KSX_95760 [Ktedonospora formicarum]